MDGKWLSGTPTTFLSFLPFILGISGNKKVKSPINPECIKKRPWYGWPFYRIKVPFVKEMRRIYGTINKIIAFDKINCDPFPPDIDKD